VHGPWNVSRSAQSTPLTTALGDISPELVAVATVPYKLGSELEALMTARLYRVVLPVSDIEVAAKFYGAVLGEPGQRVSSGRHYFGDNERGAILACYNPVADGDQLGEGWRQHPFQYLYFAVDDLECARRVCIVEGARDVTEIQAMPWGETIFYALDPFGNPISFVQSGTEFTG